MAPVAVVSRTALCRGSRRPAHGARCGDFPEAGADDIPDRLIWLVDGVEAWGLLGDRSDFDRMARVVEAELGLVWGPQLTKALAWSL